MVNPIIVKQAPKSILIVFLLIGSFSFLSCQPEQLDNSMVLISAGTFIMGSAWDYGNPDQKPIHEVHLDDYYIDRYEVTNENFQQFIEAGGYEKRQFWSEEGWQWYQAYVEKRRKLAYHLSGRSDLNLASIRPTSFRRVYFNQPKQPVTGVNWYEAQAYAKWAKKRLPTAAEWEKAARGTDKRLYPWGDTFDWANLYLPTSYGRRVNLVGSIPDNASPYGIMDMAGSVWEWTADWYSESYYSISPRENPKGPLRGNKRELRGGFWGSNRRQFRCSYRYAEVPEQRLLSIGFRCARSVR